MHLTRVTIFLYMFTMQIMW